jgi:O-Antigen ligase
MRDGESARTAEAAPVRPALSRALGLILIGLLATLLVEVLLEGWLGTVLGARHIDPSTGNPVIELAAWPKTLKSALYFALPVFAAVKFTVDRRWRELRTRADLAIAVLGVVLIVAGLVGGTRAVIIGEALFVYFRGATAFYAWRALNPSPSTVRRFLWTVGGLVSAYALLGIWQMIAGYRGYTMLGWVDLTWARIDRAQSLLVHPNDLGHVTGLMLLGLVAWFVASPRVALRWWLLFGVVAAGMGASQSRESLIGVVLGIMVIGLIRRAHYRRLLVITGLVLATAALPLAVSPSNRAEWTRRLDGVISAFRVPDGSEKKVEAASAPANDVTCDQNSADCDPNVIPPREIRVLYFQQGLRLWAREPVFGYGVGTFGGIVAYRNDGSWNLNPRFGPNGFDRHGFNAKTVDSFWLHLLVEAGAAGIVAYVGWMFLLGLPFVQEARRRRRQGGDPAPAVVYWAPAAVVFGALIAVFAPSLEDPLFPPLMFSVVGIAWVVLRRPSPTAAVAPAEIPDTDKPADRLALSPAVE